MKASILIPTKNGEEYLEECLNMVFKQKVDFDFEIIIVDSGSKDGTLEIIERFRNFNRHPEFISGSQEMLKQVQHDNSGAPQLKFSQIPPEEFGHGKTRNFAVSKAQGEYFVFLTQDATPADENWLKNIIKPFETDAQVAGVFGKHLPRKECDPFQRKTLNEFMVSFGKETTVYQLSKAEDKLSIAEKHFLNFFSNVNSAVRRSVFEKIPFRDVEMGEDQFWVRDILLVGYKKAYQPSAAVFHSHNYGIWNQFKRWFDEFRQHKQNQNYVGVSSAWKIFPLTLRLWLNDIRYIRGERDYNFWQKTYWSGWSFFVDLSRILAEYLGGRYEKLPKRLQNKLSMQYEIIHKNSKLKAKN